MAPTGKRWGREKWGYATAFIIGLVMADVSIRGDECMGQPVNFLESIDFEQRLGDRIPIEETFADETGAAVSLETLFQERPAILALVYYECPMLCTLVLNGLTEALQGVPLKPGEDFQIIAISIDPGETPDLAAAKKEKYLSSYGDSSTRGGWRFLTGEKSAIDRVTAQAGYRYKYDPANDVFAHPSGFVVLSPQGVITHYFYGTSYSARDLKLALIEASGGKVGSAVQKLLLRCYHYDPETGTFGFAIMNLVRFAGVLTFFTLVLLIIFLLIRERRLTISDGRGPAFGSGKVEM